VYGRGSKAGVVGAPRPPHPHRILTAIYDEWRQRLRAWEASPDGVRHKAYRKAEAEELKRREKRREDQQYARAERREAKEREAKAADKLRATAQRALLRSDGITMRERVLSALIRIGGEGSAWRVWSELGLEDSLLGDVHSGLLACVKRGEVTREIVEAFVPSHGYSGNTSSVYRVAEVPT